MNYFYSTFMAEGWKLWVIVGIVFMIAEGMNLGTFSLFFGGIGAFATAVACYFFPDISANVTWQLLLFSAMSLFSLLLLRPRILRRIHKESKLDGEMFLGKQAKAMTILCKNDLKAGSVLFEGTEWAAVLSEDSPDIPSGSAVEIVQIEGLTLRVRLVQAGQTDNNKEVTL